MRGQSPGTKNTGPHSGDSWEVLEPLEQAVGKIEQLSRIHSLLAHSLIHPPSALPRHRISTTPSHPQAYMPDVTEGMGFDMDNVIWVPTTPLPSGDHKYPILGPTERAIESL